MSGTLTVSTYFFILRPFFKTIEQQEFPYLAVPLLLALSLVVLLGIREISIATESQRHTEENRSAFLCVSVSLWHTLLEKLAISHWQNIASRVAVAICFVAMIWAGLVAFFYDYPLVRRSRQYNLDVAAQAAKLVSDDSILFTTFVDPFFGLIEHRNRIRIANPGRDKFRDFSALVEFHLKQGRSVYGAFDAERWREIQMKGLRELQKFKIIPIEIFPHCILSQIIERAT